MTERQKTPTNDEMRSAWLAYRLDHDRFGKEFYGHGAELNAEFDRYLVHRTGSPCVCESGEPCKFVEDPGDGHAETCWHCTFLDGEAPCPVEAEDAA